MKRIFAMIFAVLMCGALVACASETPDQTDVSDMNTTVAETTIPPDKTRLKKVELAAVKINGKWGYIDETGEFIINPQFEDAGLFADNGLAWIMVHGKYGYIDETGTIVINPQFDEARGFVTIYVEE